MLGQGRYSVGLGFSDSLAEQRAKQGVPVEIVDIRQLKEGSDISPASGGLSIFLSTMNGRTYVAESANELSTTNWQTLCNVVGTGAEQIITDTNAPARQRFYRIRLNP